MLAGAISFDGLRRYAFATARKTRRFLLCNSLF